MVCFVVFRYVGCVADVLLLLVALLFCYFCYFFLSFYSVRSRCFCCHLLYEVPGINTGVVCALYGLCLSVLFLGSCCLLFMGFFILSDN